MIIILGWRRPILFEIHIHTNIDSPHNDTREISSTRLTDRWMSSSSGRWREWQRHDWSPPPPQIQAGVESRQRRGMVSSPCTQIHTFSDDDDANSGGSSGDSMSN